MRLSALAHRDGISSFNRADFDFVASKLSTDPERLILVGGQAIEVWGVLLDVPRPNGEEQALTEDTDWLGSKQDAIWLCERLGITEILVPRDHDITPNSAIAYIQRPDGRILLMDFLRAIVGPSDEEVRRLAVRVNLLGGISIFVLHPLLCLESRFANLAVIESKRRGNGPQQALWAIDIARAYLRNLVKTGASVDEVAKACRRLAETAEYKHGQYCHLEFHLDALSAVPDDVVDYVGGRFVSEEWPRVLKRIRDKQARWAGRAEQRRQSKILKTTGQAAGAEVGRP